MSSAADLTAILAADTRLAEQAIQKLVAKPYKLNFSIDQGASGALGRIRSQLGEFDKSLAASNARVLAFSASAGAMFAVTKSLREMVRVTVEVERKMTSINSILGAGRSQFKQFGNDLFKIARDTSTSFEEVADAAEELARQGVGIEETLKRTSSAMKLAKVSGVEVRTAVDAITAALNSNNDAWLDSEKLINKLVAVDAKFAVSAGGLAEAIKRVGSVASDAGLDIDDLIAAITSAQQTTARGEAVIGNALKTIFTRAQRPKVIEDFEALGIATKKASGENESLATVLTNVAKRYDDLSSAQQQSVSELVGGVYQINILKALFRDLGKETSFFGNALKTSQRATNEADLRIAQLNETLDAMFKKLVVNMTQVGSGVGENVFGPLFKNLLKSANSGLEAVSREMSGESGKFLGNAFEAIFKGIGNTLNSPLLIGGFITIGRFMIQTAREGREAIKTLAGLNNSFHSLEVVTADASNWLRQNPKYLQDIVVASKSAEGATRALTAATMAYNREIAERAALDASVGTHASAMARASGVISIPGRGGTEKLQATKKVPNFAPLSSAIARESFSVNPALIRIGSHSSLRGPGNPDGMGVYNLRDEPLGLGQGVERAKNQGLNPKTHGIPNYADGPVRKWVGRQREAYMGGEGSPDPGNKFMYAMGASMAAPAISTFGGNSAGTKIGEEAVNALSLYFTLSTFLRGPKGGKVAGGAAILSGILGSVKQFNNSFNTLDTEIQVLKDNIQKASGGLNKYATTLEQLQGAYLNNNIGAEKIGALQNKLAQSLSQLPAELRGQLIGAKSGGQVQDIIGKYTESQDSKLREKEFAMGLSTLLNEQSVLRRGSLLGFQESGTKTGQEKLDAIADSLLSSISESGLKKIGGAAGLAGGDLISTLSAAGLGGSTLSQLKRVNSGELKTIQGRMVGEQGSRESDVKKFQALAPQRQREIEQAQMLEKRMKGARDTIKQAFEQIGQLANLRISIAGRRGLMNATGIGEQMQGTANLIGETGSPGQAAIANYKAQIAANQIQAASGISNVFGGLRGGISTLFSNTDLSRMGDIPAKMRGGQRDLMGILGGSSVSGIGEDAISLFKSLGKDDDTAEIKKLMADSNEKLVEIYQTLEEQNKLAEIQKNIALQRAEFERTLKVGGGLGSFMDKGVKMQQLTDIYSGKFGVQTGIFKGQGSIDLLKSFLGAGGQVSAPGFSKLLGVATEARAQDIISSQKDLNRAFQGTGLSLGVPNLADARKVAETQIASELKTGDSAMEKQMTQLQAALANTLSTSMGGQFNNAAQVFANVLAGSSTFLELNSTISSTQQALKNLDATLKSLQGGGGYGAVTRAGGNIPISAAATEKMMAKAGGYNPGYIRRAGNLIYNSAERVDYLPGVREPVISPPPGSLAGFLHKQNLNATFGFAALGDDPFDVWKAKQLELKRKQRARAAISFRDKGRFTSFPKADLSTVAGMQQVSGRSVPLPQIVPSQTPRVIGVGNYGEFPPIKSPSGIAGLVKPPSYLAYPNVGTSLTGLSQLEKPYIASSGVSIKTPVPRVDLPIAGGVPRGGYVAPDGRIITAPLPQNPNIRAGLSSLSRPYVPPGVNPLAGFQLPSTTEQLKQKALTDFTSKISKMGLSSGVNVGFDDPLQLNEYLRTGKMSPLSSSVGSVNISPFTSGGAPIYAPSKTLGQRFAPLTQKASAIGKRIIAPGARSLFGPLALGLDAASTALDFANPRMADKIGGGKRFKAFDGGYSKVGGRYLDETSSLISGLEVSSGTGRYGTALGIATSPSSLTKFFGLQSSTFDLMESQGDVEVMQRKYDMSQARKSKRLSLINSKTQPSQSGQFSSRASYLEEMYGNQEKGTRGVIGTLTHGKDLQGQIGAMRAGLRVLTPNKENDATREQLRADIRNKTLQYNTETIAKTFGIKDPKQLKALQIGVANASEGGRDGLANYYKTLAKAGYKPVAQTPTTQDKAADGKPAGDKSEINVNVNMGGNLGIKNAGVEFSEEQYVIINSIISQVAKGIEEKIKAIVQQQPAEVRSSVAASSPPTTALPDAGGPAFFS